MSADSICDLEKYFDLQQINCSDVVLFWRIQQVIKVTANALRQQVVNREARRVDKEIKEVLGEQTRFSHLGRLVMNKLFLSVCR